MHPKKNIKIPHGVETYCFIVNLSTKSLDLITKSEIGNASDHIIGMIDVPDRVQINFYRTLRKLNDDYQREHPDISK